MRNAQTLRQFSHVIKPINRLTWTRRTFVQHRRKTCVLSPCGFQSISSFTNKTFSLIYTKQTMHHDAIKHQLRSRSHLLFKLCRQNLIPTCSTSHTCWNSTDPTELCLCLCVSYATCTMTCCTSPYVPLHSSCVLAMLPVLASDRAAPGRH